MDLKEFSKSHWPVSSQSQVSRAKPKVFNHESLSPHQASLQVEEGVSVEPDLNRGRHRPGRQRKPATENGSQG